MIKTASVILSPEFLRLGYLLFAFFFPLHQLPILQLVDASASGKVTYPCIENFLPLNMLSFQNLLFLSISGNLKWK